MIFLNLFETYSAFTLIVLAIASFFSGFIDAVVGGGGLIQVPATLIQFPNTALPTLFGTNKIASLSGTSIAAFQYSKKIKFNFKLLFVVSIFAFMASFAGAKLISKLNVVQLKPLILVILIFIAVYTFVKKDLGSEPTKNLSLNRKLFYGMVLGTIVGFYDGFFGPGTGSFFVLGFVVVIGFDFLHASAYSKIINCVTNISALFVFVNQKNYLLGVAIVMAIFNMLGNYIGSKFAIKKGNKFVRTIFLFIVIIMILRFSYDVFSTN